MDIKVIKVFAERCDEDAAQLVAGYFYGIDKKQRLEGDAVGQALKLFSAADQMRQLAHRTANPLPS